MLSGLCTANRMKMTTNLKSTAFDMALTGMAIALIEVCKAALMGVPNIELTSFWIIMFTLFLGKKILFVIPAFILIEGCMFGFGIWWVMYLYAWPLLALLTWIFRKQEQMLFWAILSGFFGLFFGALCALPYVVNGSFNGGIRSGLYAGFTWWIAGIPYDLLHCAGNFVLMAILYVPVKTVFSRIKKIRP